MSARRKNSVVRGAVNTLHIVCASLLAIEGTPRGHGERRAAKNE